MEGPRMTSLQKRLYQAGVVPLVTVEEPKQAVKVADALLAGGLEVMEIAFRTPAAAEALRLVVHHHPTMLVGAGTVLSNDQVDAARRAGAKFVVSPGLSNRVVRRCEHLKMPLIPGVATPSEVQRALEQGFHLMGFFPAGALGGAATIRALAAPFPQVRFMPAGDVDVGNLGAYLDLPTVVACCGSWMVPEEFIASRNFRQIRALLAETVNVVKETRGDSPQSA